MNCWDARALLLEADPAELKCTVPSEIVEHLEACDNCHALAARILQAESALGTELAGVQPRTPLDAALQSASLRAATVRRKRRWWAALSATAAAGVAGLLLFGRGGPDLPGRMWQPQPWVAASGIDVEAPLGKDVVVFDIEDRPDLVVVWFFDKGED